MKNTLFASISQTLLLYRGLFHSPAVYKLLTKSSSLQVFGFFTLSHMVVAALAVGVFYVRTLPQALSDSAQSIQILRSYLPEDLLFNWNADEQQLSIIESQQNQLPVHVPSTAFASLKSIDSAGIASLPKYFLSIDTQTDTQDNQTYSSANSLFVLNSVGITVNQTTTNSSSQIEYSLLPQFQDSFQVNGAFVIAYLEQTLTKVGSTAQQAWPLVLVLALPGMMILTTITLFLDIFFVILLVKLNQYRMTILESIKLALLVAGVAALMNQLVLALYTTVQVPIYTLTFWLIISYLFLFNSRLWK